MMQTVRVAAIQAKRRTISYKVDTADEDLKRTRDNLCELTALAEHFGTLWIGRASRERLKKIAEQQGSHYSLLHKYQKL